MDGHPREAEERLASVVDGESDDGGEGEAVVLLGEGRERREALRGPETAQAFEGVLARARRGQSGVTGVSDTPPFAT